ALVGLAAIAATVVWMGPAPTVARPAAAAAPSADYAAVGKVIEQRCLMCHGAQMQMKNVRLDSPDGVKQHAQGIYQQVVVTRIMPMNNATGMTDDERALVGAWFQAGAKAP
ncbi:MAG TPA: hypothetical protein VLJ86_26045, partial [Ramlibacter sp.]|nr:hypothetical protein [Ramlibacter sp.]